MQKITFPTPSRLRFIGEGIFKGCGDKTLPKKGDKVLYNFVDTTMTGTISCVNDDDTYAVLFDNGDTDDEVELDNLEVIGGDDGSSVKANSIEVAGDFSLAEAVRANPVLLMKVREGDTEIAEGLFKGNKELNTLKGMPASITEFGEAAFSNTALDSVEGMEATQLTDTGAGVFKRNENLTAIISAHFPVIMLRIGNNGERACALESTSFRHSHHPMPSLLHRSPNAHPPSSLASLARFSPPLLPLQPSPCASTSSPSTCRRHTLKSSATMCFRRTRC